MTKQLTGNQATEALYNGVVLEGGERLYKYDYEAKRLVYRDVWETKWKPSTTTPEALTSGFMFTIYEG